MIGSTDTMRRLQVGAIGISVIVITLSIGSAIVARLGADPAKPQTALTKRADKSADPDAKLGIAPANGPENHVVAPANAPVAPIAGTLLPAPPPSTTASGASQGAALPPATSSTAPLANGTKAQVAPSAPAPSASTPPAQRHQ